MIVNCTWGGSVDPRLQPNNITTILTECYVIANAIISLFFNLVCLQLRRLKAMRQILKVMKLLGKVGIRVSPIM